MNPGPEIDSFVGQQLSDDSEIVHRAEIAALTGLAVGGAIVARDYLRDRQQPMYRQPQLMETRHTQPRHAQHSAGLKFGYAFLSLVFIVFAWAFGTEHPQAMWSLIVLSIVALGIMTVDRK